MRNVILSAILVAFSTIATAQTFESPYLYKSVEASYSNEWFMLEGDTNMIIIYGYNKVMDKISKDWFEEYGLDINNPDEIEYGKKFDTKIWYVDYERGGYIKVALYDDKGIRTLIVGTTQ